MNFVCPSYVSATAPRRLFVHATSDEEARAAFEEVARRTFKALVDTAALGGRAQTLLVVKTPQRQGELLSLATAAGGEQVNKNEVRFAGKEGVSCVARVSLPVKETIVGFEADYLLVEQTDDFTDTERLSYEPVGRAILQGLRPRGSTVVIVSRYDDTSCFSLRHWDSFSAEEKASNFLSGLVQAEYEILKSFWKKGSRGRKVLERLVKEGSCALSTRVTESGFTLLHSAVLNASTEALRLLCRVARKEDLNLTTKDGTTALFLAVKQRDLEKAKVLLDAGAHVYLGDHVYTVLSKQKEFEKLLRSVKV